jgi:serine/threonine protein kinase
MRVAIKHVPWNEGTARREFIREAKNMFKATENSPSAFICKLMAVCIEESFPALIMELLEFPITNLLIEDTHAILNNEENLLKIAAQTASGLQWLHEQRIFHGDLSARNLLFKDGIIKVRYSLIDCYLTNLADIRLWIKSFHKKRLRILQIQNWIPTPVCTREMERSGKYGLIPFSQSSSFLFLSFPPLFFI